MKKALAIAGILALSIIPTPSFSGEKDKWRIRNEELRLKKEELRLKRRGERACVPGYVEYTYDWCSCNSSNKICRPKRSGRCTRYCKPEYEIRGKCFE